MALFGVILKLVGADSNSIHKLVGANSNSIS
jgi:hypothetical protein